MPSPFLTAEWHKLIMAQYEVSPATLAPWLPPDVEVDLYQNRCYVSLVGFLFDRVRLLGLPVPFHTRFEEVNLRFYVARTEPDGTRKRGVVFIREFVPRAAITLIANSLYEEPYATLPMRHSIASTPGVLTSATPGATNKSGTAWPSKPPLPRSPSPPAARKSSSSSTTGATPHAPTAPPPSTASSIHAGRSIPSETLAARPTSPRSTVRPSHPSTAARPQASCSPKAPASPSPPAPACQPDHAQNAPKPVPHRPGTIFGTGYPRVSDEETVNPLA